MFGRKKDQEDPSMGIGSGFEPGADAPKGPRVTALDIQQRQFSPQRKGYSEAEVDEFLDQITEELVRLSAEVKRGDGGGAGALTEAERIKQAARDEADAILADARARAGGMGEPGQPMATGKESVQAFLKQERDFLHSIAGMIQEHAETIREMARAAKDASDAARVSAGAGSVAAASAASGDTGSSGTASAGGSAWAATSLPSGSTQAVIQIPASDVDAPQAVALEETAVVEDGGGVDGSEDVLVSQEAPTDASGEGGEGEDQRSLREMFWGED